MLYCSRWVGVLWFCWNFWYASVGWFCFYFHTWSTSVPRISLRFSLNASLSARESKPSLLGSEWSKWDWAGLLGCFWDIWEMCSIWEEVENRLPCRLYSLLLFGSSVYYWWRAERPACCDSDLISSYCGLLILGWPEMLSLPALSWSCPIISESKSTAATEERLLLLSSDGLIWILVNFSKHS